MLFHTELDFVKELVDIGNRLKYIPTKEEKSKRLIYELYMLNFQLPKRVWLPLYSKKCSHLVLRIPYTAACVLNSKDKVIYFTLFFNFIYLKNYFFLIINYNFRLRIAYTLKF